MTTQNCTAKEETYELRKIIFGWSSKLEKYSHISEKEKNDALNYFLAISSKDLLEDLLNMSVVTIIDKFMFLSQEYNKRHKKHKDGHNTKVG